MQTMTYQYLSFRIDPLWKTTLNRGYKVLQRPLDHHRCLPQFKDKTNELLFKMAKSKKAMHQYQPQKEIPKIKRIDLYKQKISKRHYDKRNSFEANILDVPLSSLNMLSFTNLYIELARKRPSTVHKSPNNIYVPMRRPRTTTAARSKEVHIFMPVSPKCNINK